MHGAFLLGALLLALILLALSALIHSAAAATLGGGWPSLGAIWLLAIGIALLAISRARSGAVACRRMCLINGVASLGLLAVGVVHLPGEAQTPDVILPYGPIFGFAVAAGVLVIVGMILAALFFAAWYVLSRHQMDSERHA